VLARAYIDFYNELVSDHADLIRADLNFARDLRSFEQTTITSGVIYAKIGALGKVPWPPDQEGPPPEGIPVEETAEAPAVVHIGEILHLVDQEITKVDRLLINPVSQTDSVHLQLPAENTLQLKEAWGSIPIEELTIGPLPFAVACASRSRFKVSLTNATNSGDIFGTKIVVKYWHAKHENRKCSPHQGALSAISAGLAFSAVTIAVTEPFLLPSAENWSP
jgi:hypothetical protein